jgi:putative hemolysin
MSMLTSSNHATVSDVKPGALAPGAEEHITRTYRLRIARSAADLRAAQALRFEVFNLELNEGLPTSFATGLDEDRFDAVCDHLLVESLEDGATVGTYRLQTGTQAAEHHGYYSAQEFDFSPFEPRRAEIVELGRACVARAHRNVIVLQMLWRGIAAYTHAHHAHFLVGCSSLTGTDPRLGATVFTHLARLHLAPPEWRTQPLPAWACPLGEMLEVVPKVPKLLAAYLALRAKICGPPALDREFKTIDFLTVLDLRTAGPRADKYLSSPPGFYESLLQQP